jgi:hypothetical protein
VLKSLGQAELQRIDQGLLRISASTDQTILLDQQNQNAEDT